MTIGIDLAKNIFAVHGVDEHGKAALIKPKVSRDQLSRLIIQLPPCLIGMEACSGAHHWARLFRTYGHTVKLVAPKFVPLPPERQTRQERCGRRGGHLRSRDAAPHAFRPDQGRAPTDHPHVAPHAPRLCRTTYGDRQRGLMSEFGIVLPQKVAGLRQNIGAHREDLHEIEGRTSLVSNRDLRAELGECSKRIFYLAMKLSAALGRNQRGCRLAVPPD
jgi:transposase